MRLDVGQIVRVDPAGRQVVIRPDGVVERAGLAAPVDTSRALLDIPLGQGDDRLLAFEPLLSPEQPSAAAFLADMREGTWCGRPLERLSRAERRHAKRLLNALAWILLARGELDDYAAWRPYVRAMLRLMPERARGQLVYAYSYRVTLGTDAAVAGLDQAKISAFAYIAVGKDLQLKDAQDMTDVDLDQRTGVLRVRILGSRTLPGGQLSRYGFWIAERGAFAAGQVTGSEPMSLTWTQGNERYSADITLTPPEPGASGLSAPGFPGPVRNGLVILDATLSAADQREIVAGYSSWLRTRGFQIGAPERVPSLRRVVLERLGTDDPADYVVREGHSDGDLVNAMHLAETGLRIEAWHAGGERLTILVGDPKSRKAPLSEPDLAQALRSNAAMRGRPVALLDASCWGLSKVALHRAWLPPDVALVTGASTPVSYLAGAEPSATGSLLDAIRGGARFDEIRSVMSARGGAAGGQEDRFILPDDLVWSDRPPVARPSVILSRLTGDRREPYRPDGYW